VSERLGLQWGEVHRGASELQGVKRPVIEHFSKRRAEMLRAAEEGGIGLETKAAAESAALATRDRKQYGIETHTWREEVRARAAELGLGAEELGELIREGWERPVGGLIEQGQAAERSLGDPGQLASVQAGGWLGAVGREARGPPSHRGHAPARPGRAPSAERSPPCTTVVPSTTWTGLNRLDASTRSATRVAHTSRLWPSGSARSQRSGRHRP
jgi:hypothetical protein